MVEYGIEDFAEQNYGEAREYVLEEQAMYEGVDAFLGINFVGFGLHRYNEAEDSSFESENSNSSSSSSSSDSSHSEKANNDDDDDFEDDEEADFSQSRSNSRRPDPLGSIWRNNEEAAFEEPSSSSATPIRPRRRPNRSAPPPTRNNNSYPLRNRNRNVGNRDSVDLDLVSDEPTPPVRRRTRRGRAPLSPTPPSDEFDDDDVFTPN